MATLIMIKRLSSFAGLCRMSRAILKVTGNYSKLTRTNGDQRKQSHFPENIEHSLTYTNKDHQISSD